MPTNSLWICPLALVLAHPVLAAEPAVQNVWTSIAEGGTGPRVSPALVWSSELKRFVLVSGTISHAHKPPFPYDVLSFNATSRQWENELPPGGEKWGPRVGPVEPPKFKSPYFEIEDVDGHIRPWQRHARMWYHGAVAPWNGNLYTLMCGRTLAYDLDQRRWKNLEPGLAPAPQSRNEQGSLNWSAMCADPVNREILLFGGAGVPTRRGDPGTWVYSTERNEWHNLEPKVQPPLRALAPMVYDPGTRKIILFGGDSLDTLRADTWVYDCVTRTWEERKPAVSPSPRFGHALLHLPRSGKIVMLGGVGYTSSTSYQALLYRPLPFEIWTYDVAGNIWNLVKRYDEGGPTQFLVDASVAAVDEADRVLWYGPDKTGRRANSSRTWMCSLDVSMIDEAGTSKFGVTPGTVEHRSESYDPAWYSTDVPPADPAAVAKQYELLPANTWVAIEAPKWPLNRMGGGWSTVAYDTDRQQLLHLGGGHSSYFGNDVAHFDTTTNRFHISGRPQFALDYNYDLTGPGPWAFNGGPWGNHNYHAYAYDPVRKRLVYIRNEFTHVYDPASQVWPADERLEANPFFGSKYTSYITTTPEGCVVWAFRASPNNPVGVWKLSAKGWVELPTKGESLPRPVTDGSTITFDAKRNRLLLTTTLGEKDVRHSGQVWSCDLKTGDVRKLDPAGREQLVVNRFARESVYLPHSDRVMFGYLLGGKTRVPFYDIASNAWHTVDLAGSEFISSSGSGSSVDLGLQYDANRNLVWAVLCKLHPGSVRVLRLDESVKLVPLK